MIEPVVRQFNSTREASLQPKTSPASISWNASLDTVPVAVTAEWHSLQVPARQIASLEVGDLLPAGNPAEIEVRFANVPRFIGRLGAAGNKRAIELLKTLSSPSGV
jgi:flagellar motor switch protein FliM